MSPCVCLGHPAAACRCQCGCPSAGCLPLACPHGVPGRHEGGRQVVVWTRGCRLPPWPESVSGCLGRGGAVPGQPPRGGRCSMAGRCGPSGLHVWPLPRCGSARAVARGWLGCRRGGVFSVWKRGIFVFCTIFHRHYLHLVVFMCYLCIDNQHPGNHGPGPLGARLRYPRKNNAVSLGRPARPAPARRGITEKLKL